MLFHSLLYVIFVSKFFIVASFISTLNSNIGFRDNLETKNTSKLSTIHEASPSPNFLFANPIIFREQYSMQKLDHFNPTTDEFWFQRYFQNDFYYENGGPVFLFVYGESEADSAAMSKDLQWTIYAKKFNAMCFGLEHRFYGKSQPTTNTNTSNLQYLTTEQVLADIAYFIVKMNEYHNFPTNTKWILFGGSYAGALVAWARMKYPHLVHGAVSSSAPILAKADNSGYFQTIQASLRAHSPKCVKNIAIANRQLKRAIQSKSGRARISKLFKLCNNLKNDSSEIALLFEALADNVAFAVQYNSKFYSTERICSIMNDDSVRSPLQRYANVNSNFLNFINEDCSPLDYEKNLEYWRNDSLSSKGSVKLITRVWLYQLCSAYGFFVTSSKPDDLFGQYFPLSFFVKLCRDVFGKQFNGYSINNAIRRTNFEYGGLEYNSNNVIFTQGSLDPWHALGINKQMKSAAYHVIFIKNSTHCDDMNPASDDDSEELKTARRKIVKILQSWLENEKSNLMKDAVVDFEINGESQTVSTSSEATVFQVNTQKRLRMKYKQRVKKMIYIISSKLFICREIFTVFFLSPPFRHCVNLIKYL